MRGVIVAVIAALLLAVGGASSPPTVARVARLAPPVCATKPTVVLVHGAWAGTSSWTPVLERLRHEGYPVRAFANPLRGLTGDAAAAYAFLGSLHGPLVVVGHSYGGAVITNAADGNANVKALVYVDAAAPAVGETTGQLSGEGSALGGDPADLYDTLGTDLYLRQSVFQRSFAPDLPMEESATLWAEQRPAAQAAFTTKSARAAWRTKPSWYVIGDADKIITPQSQHMMAKRAGSRVTTVPGGSHLTLISHPGPVTDTILAAARATC
ncbi:alpha/beta hydrolase [Dactylosporangium sp. AC04546]|uniref:alpha/beta fold hydrolase n=1 Tax=Dactylosporangium sp. AC04546 TaxID=2862460 RepID=UPI001EDFB373|nr:alpha/beta hydrolase [Dactylosporangium sp. AC04546]WVK87447.1 alpha/beta hydrolase [Dactylosporangium sp. AC04546]